MISRETVDEVLRRNDIESVISPYVTLKRAGSNLKGLCPFHNEKTPSFVVYPADNSFFCFGCSIGGNAITFIRQIEHLDYPDAIEFLAKKAGITVVRDETTGYRQETGIRKDRLLRMNVDAARFFHNSLKADNPGARACLSYFMDERKLEMSTIKHFGLGYAPDSYDAMLKHMTSLGYTPDELVEGFFAVKSKKGSYFDNFRNRAIFPIFDVAGNVIAFGGRRLDPNDNPKYRNTMDTVVYKKSRHVYALNFAKNFCRENLIVCEGYLDAISLHQAGINNVVASLGTAFTSEQARLLSRYTKKVFLCFDSDEAGQKATARTLKILPEAGIETVVIEIPGEKDPDDYVKTYGKDKFLELIHGAKSKFEYNMEKILAPFDLNKPQDKVNALGKLTDLISEVYSKAERDIYIQVVSQKLGVNSKSLKEDVEKSVRRATAKHKKEESTKLRQSGLGYADKVNPDYAKAPGVAGYEEVVLGMLLLYPEHRKLVRDGSLLTDEDFFTEFNRRVFGYIMSIDADDGEANDINELFTPEEVGRITQIKNERMKLSDNGKEVFLEALDMLHASLEKKQTEGITTIDALTKFINGKK
ncbi:MAG: DNA primase [Clostridia bacterium]|nr:DNA primase [Clostridia bacterium]